MGDVEACWEGNSPYKKESNEATRDATPQTMTVALVRLAPVPPPDAPPGMSTSRYSKGVGKGAQPACESGMSLGWNGNCWQLQEDPYLLAIDDERYHSRMLPSVVTIMATIYGRCCVIMRLRGLELLA